MHTARSAHSQEQHISPTQKKKKKRARGRERKAAVLEISNSHETALDLVKDGDPNQKLLVKIINTFSACPLKDKL